MKLREREDLLVCVRQTEMERVREDLFVCERDRGIKSEVGSCFLCERESERKRGRICLFV